LNKSLLIVILALLSFSIVFGADGCVSNDVCTWYAYDVSSEVGVNLSFSYENSSTTSEYEMISLGDGKYLYNATHNLTGNVLGCARSYNSSGTIDTSCESKEIYYNSSDEILGLGFMSVFWLTVLFLIVLGTALFLIIKD